MFILGISAFYHDSAACIVRDGQVIAAAQEERFTRRKHDASFPRHAIQFCLKQAKILAEDLDYVCFYESPPLKMDRLIKTYLMYAPWGIGSFLESMPLWLREKLWLKSAIRKELGFKGKILCSQHHESHAAGAFYPSPFDRAAFLTMDGVGEWTTLSYGVAEGNRLEIKGELHFPHSLGLLYSAFTYYAGFKVNSGEYKVMGLAPYGKPKYMDKILDNLIDLKDDGSFRLNMDYFNYCTGFTMTNDKFHKLFGRVPRKPEGAISQMDMDLASSIQKLTEEVVLRIGRHVHSQTGEQNLCMSGGVALNCVANGRFYREGPFERLWIQPAAGDAGSALGAALWTWYKYLGNERKSVTALDRQMGSYLGTVYSDEFIEEFLRTRDLSFSHLRGDTLFFLVAEKIAEGNVVGWFDGPMEFGPRALGARSILGDPRSEDMQSTMNLKIKYRESFRPFAPAVLYEETENWFEVEGGGKNRNGFLSPYMLMVGHIRKDKRKDAVHSLKGLDRVKEIRSEIPAVTHVDHSARIQTVHKELNPSFYELIKAFEKITGCPVLINTSFNVRGEPIVESPEDAYRCFMRTEMDYLVMGSFLLNKKEQPVFTEQKDWRKEFQLD